MALEYEKGSPITMDLMGTWPRGPGGN
jgi:hypothetical protein